MNASLLINMNVHKIGYVIVKDMNEKVIYQGKSYGYKGEAGTRRVFHYDFELYSNAVIIVQ